jgi:hypothetical protein
VIRDDHRDPGPGKTITTRLLAERLRALPSVVIGI